jgi:adenylate cyclase
VGSLLGISRSLARVAEIFALSHVAVNLLDTSVGRSAGARIMAGKIQRGDTDSIRAVIWFSKLLGFTFLVSSIEPPALIRALNDVFECQVPAIERHGGEILKYMGDGLFVIFPTDAGAEKGSDAALSAASEAFTALDALNAVRAGHGPKAILSRSDDRQGAETRD